MAMSNNQMVYSIVHYIFFLITYHLEIEHRYGMIWIWVKIRYPRNQMVHTKTYTKICGPIGLKIVISHSNVASPKGKPHVFPVLFIQSPRFSIVLHSYKKVIISIRYRSIPLLLYSINHISSIPSSIKPTQIIKTTPDCLFWEISDLSICFLIAPLEKTI